MERTARRRNLRGTGDRLRAELIEAAIRVLEGLGQDEPFSLRAVAKEAHISAPSVYIQFQDKTALLLAVLEKLFAQLSDSRTAAEEQAAAAGGGPWERLMARSVAYVEFGVRQPGHYRVLYEGRAVPRLNDPRVAAFGQPMLDRTAQLIREISSSSKMTHVTDDVDRLALLLWVGLHGVVSLRINKPTIDWPDPAELAEQVLRAVTGCV